MKQQIDQQITFMIAPDTTNQQVALTTTGDGIDIPITDLLAVELWRTIGLPIKTLAMKERHGRVYLVEFMPHGQPDPMLPIALVDLGDGYRYALKRYAEWLLIWRRVEPRRWSQIAARRLGRVYAALAGVAHLLTQGELNYIRVKLAVMAATPERSKN